MNVHQSQDFDELWENSSKYTMQDFTILTDVCRIRHSEISLVEFSGDIDEYK